MAIPSSGQLMLRADIALEVDGSDTGSNISLRTLSSTAGFSSPDSMSEFYGYSSYTAPSVSTSAPSSVTASSMQLNGFFQRASIDSPGITSWGFYFGTNPNMTSNPRYTGATVAGNGFYMNRTGLNSSTTYYVWAFVTDSVQETTGSVVSRVTNAPFSPSYFGFNESSSGWSIQNIYGPVYTSLQYYNPDTGSYVQYAIYSLSGLSSYKQFSSSNWSKSGNTGNHCTNSRNLRYDTITVSIGRTNRTSVGMQDSIHTANYPSRYITSRTWSGSSPGFSPSINMNVINSYPGQSNWQVWGTTSHSFPAGSTLNSAFYFNYTTSPT